MTEDKKTVSAPAKTSSFTTRALKGLIVFILIIFALIAGYVYFTLNWSYAEGDRAGVLLKFSKKGWICKTWEGELTMIGLPGGTPEKFLFTVRDEMVARKLRAAIGKKADLTYEEHRGIISSCYGDTAYFVTDVKVLSP